MIAAKFKASSVASIIVGCTVFATSCAVSPNDLPLSGETGSDGYEITLQFTSVLNLPTGAYVMMDGLRVGEVDSVNVSDDTVAVAVKLKPDTDVPVDTRAIIRQNTLLGDTYVALDRSQSAVDAANLSPGAVISSDHTTSPPQLEDTIAVLAAFVNGGTIQKVQDVIARLNTVMPAQDSLQKLASVTADDLRDLSQNTNEIDRLLAGLDSTAVAVNDKSDVIDTVFDQSSMQYWRSLSVQIISYLGVILPSIGSIFEGGMWMVPMLESLSGTAGQGREVWDEAIPATEKVATFLRTTVLPFAEHPSINVRSIESANGDALIGDMTDVLRMLGAVR